MTVRLTITTSDQELCGALQSEKIPHLTVRVPTRDSIEWLPSPTATFTFFIETSKVIALSLFSRWLYDRLVKKKPDKASVDNTDVVNDPTKVTVIISNYITLLQQEANKEEKHE